MEKFDIKKTKESTTSDSVKEIEENIIETFADLIIKSEEIGSGKFNSILSTPDCFFNGTHYRSGICTKKKKLFSGDKNAFKKEQLHSFRLEKMFLESIPSVKSSAKYEILDVLRANKIRIDWNDFIFSPKPILLSTIEDNEYLVMERINGIDIKKMAEVMNDMDNCLDNEDLVGFEEILKDYFINIENLTKIFNVDFIRNIFKKVATIMLEKLHESGNIYHRDLHEGNVMIDFNTLMPVFIDYGEAVSVFGSESEKEIYTTKIIVNGRTAEYEYLQKDEILLEEALTNMEKCVISHSNIISKYNDIKRQQEKGGESL